MNKVRVSIIMDLDRQFKHKYKHNIKRITNIVSNYLFILLGS